MKKLFFGFFALLLFLSSFASSISFKSLSAKENQEEIVNDLVNSEEFANSAYSYILSAYKLVWPYAKNVTKDDFEKFKTDFEGIKDPMELSQVSDVLKKYNVDFEVQSKNLEQLTTSMLRMIDCDKRLIELDNFTIFETISMAIDKGIQSNSTIWKNAFEQSDLKGELNTLEPVTAASGPAKNDGLTASEVWGCLKGAFVSGVASIVGIAGLVEAAKKEGMALVIGSVAKWLAGKVAWITAAIMAAEIGICLYDSYRN